jgi:hypothetical protein
MSDKNNKLILIFSLLKIIIVKNMLKIIKKTLMKLILGFLSESRWRLHKR